MTCYLRTNSRKEMFNKVTKRLTDKLIGKGYKVKILQFKDKELILRPKEQPTGSQLLVIPMKFNDNNNQIK